MEIFFITFFMCACRIPTSDKTQPSNVVATQKKKSIAPSTTPIFTPRTPNKSTNTPNKKKSSLLTTKWLVVVVLYEFKELIIPHIIWTKMALGYLVVYKYCDVTLKHKHWKYHRTSAHVSENFRISSWNDMLLHVCYSTTKIHGTQIL